MSRLLAHMIADLENITESLKPLGPEHEQLKAFIKGATNGLRSARTLARQARFDWEREKPVELSGLGDAATELVQAIMSPNAFPITEDGNGVAENPRITRALKAVRAALADSMLDALRPRPPISGALENLKELVSLRAERERDAAIAQRDAWLRQSDTNARAADDARRALAKLVEAARPFLSEEGGTNEEKLALRALLEAEAPEPVRDTEPADLHWCSICARGERCPIREQERLDDFHLSDLLTTDPKDQS